MILSITTDQTEEVRVKAQRIKDASQDCGDTESEAVMDCLMEFCDVLLGKVTLASFLRSQDMEDR